MKGKVACITTTGSHACFIQPETDEGFPGTVQARRLGLHEDPKETTAAALELLHAYYLRDIEGSLFLNERIKGPRPYSEADQIWEKPNMEYAREIAVNWSTIPGSMSSSQVIVATKESG